MNAEERTQRVIETCLKILESDTLPEHGCAESLTMLRKIWTVAPLDRMEKAALRCVQHADVAVRDAAFLALQTAVVAQEK